MKSTEVAAAGVKRERMASGSFNKSWDPQKNVAGGDGELGRAEKVSSSNDDGKDGLMTKRINRNSGPAFLQDGNQQPGQVTVAVSNSDEGTNTPQIAEHARRQDSGELQYYDLPAVDIQSISETVEALTSNILGQGTNSPQISEPIGNLQGPMDCKRQSLCDVAPAQCSPVASVMHDSVAAQREFTAVEVQSEAVGVVLNQSVRSSFWNSAQPSPDNVFHYEIQKIIAGATDLKKNHEDMISKLKSDCEREVSEIFTQLRGKYGLKLEETEVEFRLKRDELKRKQKKILLNQMLAENFRSKESARPFLLQQHCQLPYQPPLTPEPESSGGFVAPGHGAYASSSLGPNQTGSTQPFSVHHAAPFLSNPASRPSILNPVGPAYFSGSSGEIHTMPQSSRVATVTLNSVYSPSLLQKISSFISQPTPSPVSGYLPHNITPFDSGFLPQGATYSNPQHPPRHPQLDPVMSLFNAASPNFPAQYFAPHANSNPISTNPRDHHHFPSYGEPGSSHSHAMQEP